MSTRPKALAAFETCLGDLHEDLVEQLSSPSHNARVHARQRLALHLFEALEDEDLAVVDQARLAAAKSAVDALAAV